MLGHSAKDNIPAQAYSDHVLGVFNRSMSDLESIRDYLPPDRYQVFREIVGLSSIYHDLGKLAPHSQMVLDGRVTDVKMPNHIDGGVKSLTPCRPAAWLVYSHHGGLRDKTANSQKWRDGGKLRVRCPWIAIGFGMTTADYVDKHFQQMLTTHKSSVLNDPDITERPFEYLGPASAYRLALSLLVDGDHYDTACNYGKVVVDSGVELKAGLRLAQLDKDIAELQIFSDAPPIRRRNRQKLYDACRFSKVSAPFTSCSAYVGLGKTFAGMAYALARNPRKIIYVAPFTAILTQTVEAFKGLEKISADGKPMGERYRGLVLPTEMDWEVIGEHHHQVDWREVERDFPQDAKAYAILWETPLVFTTAVQFCETLAAAKTSRLRKYFNLAGSHIIVDESHCALPADLWPLFLRHLMFLVDWLGCRVTFMSGSMTKHWEHPEIRELSGFDREVIPLVDEQLLERMLYRESKRVRIETIPGRIDLDEICTRVLRKTGSRLVVLNTIKNAALIVRELLRRLQLRNDPTALIHISTCLTPEDRAKQLQKIKILLKSREPVIVVATSCIEAGVDLSFRHGFREKAGLSNAVQVCGRIRRSSEKGWRGSKVEVFELDMPRFEENRTEDSFTLNWDNAEAIRAYDILRNRYGTLGPQYCDEALAIELQQGLQGKAAALIRDEDELQFERVADRFRIIDDTRITCIPDDACDELESKYADKFVPFSVIVRKSFQMFEYKAEGLVTLIEEGPLEGYYRWIGAYDSQMFGYMAEKLEINY